jgi:hypothetical protein
MIALHERGLPVFGVTHPTIVAGRGSTSTPLPSLVDAARDTVAYKFSDFAYDNYSSATADRFRGYMARCWQPEDRHASMRSFQSANHPYRSCRRHRPHR